VYKHIRI